MPRLNVQGCTDVPIAPRDVYPALFVITLNLSLQFWYSFVLALNLYLCSAIVIN